MHFLIGGTAASPQDRRFALLVTFPGRAKLPSLAALGAHSSTAQPLTGDPLVSHPAIVGHDVKAMAALSSMTFQK